MILKEVELKEINQNILDIYPAKYLIDLDWKKTGKKKSVSIFVQFL